VGLVVFVVVNGVVSGGCCAHCVGGDFMIIQDFSWDEFLIGGIRISYVFFGGLVLLWAFHGVGVVLGRRRENRHGSVRVSFREGKKPLGMVSAGRVPVRSPSGAFICARCGHEWKKRSSRLVICPRCKCRN
jgi:hypothetical protein